MIRAMRTLTITRPDDWHVHLRDGDYLPDTVRDISRYFGRAIVMPNLVPPITTIEQASQYRDKILALVPEESGFKPLMTLYLTDKTDEQTIIDLARSGFARAFKLYPAGATTNSDGGVQSIEKLYPLFSVMEREGVVLAIHGESTDQSIDIFDRESRFIDEQLRPVSESFPGLKVIFEHITTKDAADFVEQSPANVAATLTVHHLLYNRNHMLAGGIRPVYYCLPVLKRDTHQQALIRAATSGNSKFFLGTDSAPHPRATKEDACGCAAGCYTAHAAIELYAEVFDAEDKLEQLEAFASHHGPDFYGLARNRDTITLEQKSWSVPDLLPFGQDQLIPIRTGDKVQWTVKD